MEDQIKKITLHEALTCQLDEDVKEVSRKLKEKKERRIFVVDKNNSLMGIITTTDLVYKVLLNCTLDMKAKDIMSAPVKSIEISDDLEKALQIMNELKTFNCPVTNKGKIAGVVSYHDIVGFVISKIEK